MKNQKGITLIALVITIIVLLILAGVSIAMLTGENGILNQATNSKTETTKAEAVEKINLALNAVKSEIYAQEISDPAYKAYTTSDSTTTLDTAITTILGKDEITATAQAEATYWYTISEKTLTISYINTNAKITTAISGSIDLDSKVITPATK